MHSPDAKDERTAKVPYILLGLGSVTLLGVAAGLTLAIEHPSVPYNVRELFLDGAPFLRALCLSASLLLLGFFASLLAPWLSAQKLPVFMLIALSVLFGLINYLLVRASVTVESIHDIVGAPVWYDALANEDAWGGVGAFLIGMVSSAAVYDALEIALRYLALASPIALSVMALVAGIWHSHYRQRGSGVGYGLALIILAVPWLYLCRMLAMNFAATDNIRELVVGGGNMILGGEALIFSLVVVIGINIAILGSYDPERKSLRNWSIFASLAGPIVGWFLLTAGLADTVSKYGGTFSPINFLFGADRNADLSWASLFGRWLILYYGTVCIMALGVASGLALSTLWADARSRRTAPQSRQSA